jgi:hypothetical protein
METKDDFTGRRIETGNLGPIRPVSSESPLVEFQVLRDGIDVGGVLSYASRRNEVLRARIPEIGFVGLDVIVRRSFRAGTVDRD